VALGAHNATLKRMLLSRMLAPVLGGVTLGLAGAAGMSRLIEGLLFGVTALDPATYGIAALLLVATSAVAAFVPANRVARIDPISALRAE
jgi:putative ABC transport system permease protein